MQGDFSFRRDLSALCAPHRQHLLVKASYWLPF
jgi:hypothetical protein